MFGVSTAFAVTESISPILTPNPMCDATECRTASASKECPDGTFTEVFVTKCCTVIDDDCQSAQIGAGVCAQIMASRAARVLADLIPPCVGGPEPPQD